MVKLCKIGIRGHYSKEKHFVIAFPDIKRPTLSLGQENQEISIVKSELILFVDSFPFYLGHISQKIQSNLQPKFVYVYAQCTFCLPVVHFFRSNSIRRQRRARADRYETFCGSMFVLAFILSQLNFKVK